MALAACGAAWKVAGGDDLSQGFAQEAEHWELSLPVSEAPRHSSLMRGRALKQQDGCCSQVQPCQPGCCPLLNSEGILQRNLVTKLRVLLMWLIQRRCCPKEHSAQ